MNAHETAIVSADAEIAEDVIIGPRCVIDGGVKIGRGTSIQLGAYITGQTTIGESCQIFPYAVIGTDPQDLKYGGEETSLVIGSANVIREYVTIHRGTMDGGGQTRVGNNNFVMAYCHIAHDCHIGDHVIFANAATLGGHVIVEDRAVIGGLVGVHQFTQIGAYSMTGGCSGIDRDVLPYTQAAGNRAKHFSLNLVGLRRAGFPSAKIQMLKEIYRLIFKADLKQEVALNRIESEFGETAEARHILEFVRHSRRGLCAAQA
ncbi:MAG: acyl-ACP--UDP-N-acetylglucosamine O-acyltransferase [Candidatus Coatesbacteria bacterium]|nr:acyl-ACP--UDP-N-acetylglucosamine O-acyltransferase [Candidatus Coatesbacteria bacterium]